MFNQFNRCNQKSDKPIGYRLIFLKKKKTQLEVQIRQLQQQWPVTMYRMIKHYLKLNRELDQANSALKIQKALNRNTQIRGYLTLGSQLNFSEQKQALQIQMVTLLEQNDIGLFVDFCPQSNAFFLYEPAIEVLQEQKSVLEYAKLNNDLRRILSHIRIYETNLQSVLANNMTDVSKKDVRNSRENNNFSPH